jgi:prepilin-type N-terminal cleavage/methylation domain-containing protein
MARRWAPWGRRGGFSLIEVIVAMALLTIVMILLASMSLSIGRRGRMNAYAAKRNLALSQQTGRINTMPFADLTTLSSGTTQMLVGDFSFNRRLTVQQLAPSFYVIQIVIAPIASEFRPDSVTIYRSRPPAGTPLCNRC